MIISGGPKGGGDRVADWYTSLEVFPAAKSIKHLTKSDLKRSEMQESLLGGRASPRRTREGGADLQRFLRSPS